MHVWIVIVTKNNDLTRESFSVSQDAHPSYALARGFILDRADKPKLVSPNQYVSTDYTYTIKELKVLDPRVKSYPKPKYDYQELINRMLSAETQAELMEIKSIIDEYAMCMVLPAGDYSKLKMYYEGRFFELGIKELEGGEE